MDDPDAVGFYCLNILFFLDKLCMHLVLRLSVSGMDVVEHRIGATTSVQGLQDSQEGRNLFESMLFCVSKAFSPISPRQFCQYLLFCCKFQFSRDCKVELVSLTKDRWCRMSRKNLGLRKITSEAYVLSLLLSFLNFSCVFPLRMW